MTITLGPFLFAFGDRCVCAMFLYHLLFYGTILTVVETFSQREIFLRMKVKVHYYWTPFKVQATLVCQENVADLRQLRGWRGGALNGPTLMQPPPHIVFEEFN